MKRTKLWDFPNQMYCGIIGTCFELPELRKICKRMKIRLNNASSDYDLHIGFVSAITDNRLIAKQLQRLLESKYKVTIRKFLKAKDKSALQKLWQEAQQSTDISAAYWACITHPYCDNEILMKVTGDIHMLSHLAGNSRRNDLKKISLLKKIRIVLTSEIEKLKKNHLSQTQNLAEKLTFQKEKLQALKLQNTKLASELLILTHTQVNNFKQIEKQKQRLEIKTTKQENKIAALKKYANNWKNLVITVEDKNAHLKKELWHYHKNEIILKKNQINTQASCNQSHCIGKVQKDLCGRCILYVGGYVANYQRIKEVIKNNQGKILFHDGGHENNETQLSALLPKADIVMIPIEKVSHHAALKVKRYCKTNNTQVMFLRSASVSSVITTLTKLVVRT